MPECLTTTLGYPATIQQPSSKDHWSSHAATKSNHKLMPEFAIPGRVDDTGAPIPEPRASTKSVEEDGPSPIPTIFTKSVAKATTRKRLAPDEDNIDPQLLTE
ncbi:hypothetical protein LTR97_004543 [Elasticomyces elasticus]|uniref:Uncharacterized protein n=1 Tax=Elasticomyces elasticus TaxID=574655 RepID=A0AAN7WLP2_9PEZI|nr:hypothetical protein LTR97_004543 [Elasticomyces elasticus]